MKTVLSIRLLLAFDRNRMPFNFSVTCEEAKD